jgi:archaeal cell division control protein 6
MSLFKNMLHSNETIFQNEIALDYEFVPRLLPFREEKQKYVAQCISPLLNERNGRNLFIHGAPGIGKTASIKWVLRDLEEHSDNIEALYINCWQKNTSYKIMLEICDLIGYRFVHNKKTDDLFKIIKGLLNKKTVVFVFDEVDKLEEYDFLYSLSEEIYKKSIILITNYKEWLISLDERIKSRLVLDTLEFQKYKPHEIEKILQERIKYAYYSDVWEEDAFDEIVKKTIILEDIRQGIFLLKQTGIIAEQNSSKKITLSYAKKATDSIDDYKIKKTTDLEEDTQLILKVVKENSGKKIGDLFKIYKEKEGKHTYKTFQRKIDKLEESKFITTFKTSGGIEGNTTIIKYKIEKKITDF